MIGLALDRRGMQFVRVGTVWSRTGLVGGEETLFIFVILCVN